MKRMCIKAIYEKISRLDLIIPEKEPYITSIAPFYYFFNTMRYAHHEKREVIFINESRKEAHLSAYHPCGFYIRCPDYWVRYITGTSAYFRFFPFLLLSSISAFLSKAFQLSLFTSPVNTTVSA